MISLDTSLQGDVLQLRPSMVKFSGSDASDIEICGAAYRPLPMYLNRQLIKILEDLGVPDQVFLDLQADAVERLRRTTLNPINAANFLKRNFVGEIAQTPWLIRKLDDMGLPFEADNFLRDTVEMAVLVQLRELKHRARILVEDGVTLYGIMDETGYLREGEVFVVVETEEGEPSVITGQEVIVTRSPALHPDDIQVATAVTVPLDSPLMALSNCVCFSQKGFRDLPSQLSGGDLDGDLYNIIYHPGMRLKKVYEAADYPRQPAVDIGRPVTRQDMADFFVQFMENDQLARIANLHLVLADQKPAGTIDPECIFLAEKHSTAVDFSKTGIPV